MKNNKKKSWLYYLIAILALLFGGTGAVGTMTGTQNAIPQQDIIAEQLQVEETVAEETVAEETVAEETVAEEVVAEETVAEEEVSQTQEIVCYFRNEKLLNDHYEKHGKEMGFDSAKSYESAANEIINHPDVLHRIEEEDGDDVYYLEENNGFVIVSIDGYIRTFFYPDDGLAYFNRQ